MSTPTDDPARDARALAARRLRWRRTLALTGGLLAAWFVVAFGAPWFARELDFAFFGWPFGFWVAAQGGVLVFVALIAVYACAMAGIDRAHDRARDGAPEGEGDAVAGRDAH